MRLPNVFGFVLISILILSKACPTHADDAYIRGVGGAAELMYSSRSISMMSEVVTISNPDNPSVSATFVFHNYGPAENVLIGFPGSGGGVDSNRASAKLDNFRSWVDGKPVKVAVIPDAPDSNTLDYSMWYAKYVHFRKGQTRIVVDKYSGGYGGESNGQRDFAYILKTGASWKGPIGHATIICKLGATSQYMPIQFSPSGFKRVGNTITWNLDSLKPTEDIKISWYPAFLNVRVNGSYPAAQDYYRNVKTLTLGDAKYDPSISVHPELIGDDVWMPAITAANWLGANFKTKLPGKSVEIDYKSQRVTVEPGSRVIVSSTGRTVQMTRKSVYGYAPLFPTQQSTMVNLSSLVKCLGGKYVFDRAHLEADITIH